ncbi:Acetylcholinesterase [Halotydeus destructor]|nr:Acetylcholinesterase [Halotydeus destructor]
MEAHPEAVLAFLSILVGFSDGIDSVDVTTSKGVVRGQCLQVKGQNVTEFAMIPYARPPVGRLRFAKPDEVEPWSPMVLDVTGHEPMYCWDYKPAQFISEDCLYLSVWTPGCNVRGRQLLPVFFYIYPGGFAEMGGFIDEYNASYAVRHDVISVFPRFRSNVFGYFHGNRPDAPGNLAIWDQAMALKWTSENIASFGGDPDHVTIAGVSSGAATALVHFVSPVSRSYFSRIIVMSAPLPGIGADQVVANSKKLAAILNCTQSNYVACMRRLKPEAIFQAWSKLDFFSLVPFVGDDIFPRAIMPALRQGRFNKNVPLLTGGHPMEYVASLYPECTYIFGQNSSDHPLVTVDQVKDCLKATLPNSGDLVDDAVKYYLENVDEKDGASLRAATALAIGHFTFTCPNYFASRIVAQQRDSSDVFSYYLPYGTQHAIPYCVGLTWPKPCHGEERFATFGTAFLEPQLYNDTDRTYTTEMIRLWTTFTKTGRPPNMGPYGWPAYQDVPLEPVAPLNLGASGRPIWPSYLEVTPLKPPTGPVYKPYRDCENFWSKYIDIFD